MSNPFEHSGVYRYYLAFSKIGSCEKVLDIGCGSGAFISKVTQAKKRYGCDLDKDVIGKAKADYKNVQFKYLDSTGVLPYKDNFFDVVTSLEVLEHVVEKEKFLMEILRVLKPGGTYILSVPHKGLTGWFDVGTVKHKFPRFHRMVVELVHGKDYYEDRYLGDMFGDMGRGLTEHKHFECCEIEKLLSDRFDVNETFYYGLLVPFILVFKDIFRFLMGREFLLINRFIMWDAKVFTGRIGYSALFVLNKS